MVTTPVAVGPLNHQIPIVDPKTGHPTPEFMRKWVEQNGFNGDVAGLKAAIVALQAAVTALDAKEIIAGAGLEGGGILGDPGNITLSLNEDQPWHPQGYVDGKPDAAMVIFKLVTKVSYGLDAGAPGSLFLLQTAPTTTAVFDVRKTGVSIGNVTFAAGSVYGVPTIAATAFGTYDTFEFHAPAVQDATLAGLSFLFIGKRPLTPTPGYGLGYGEFYGG